jgi:hypothetical protein
MERSAVNDPVEAAALHGVLGEEERRKAQLKLVCVRWSVEISAEIGSRSCSAG